eukprot:1406525-Rhodomonas_salina.1
MNIVFRQSVTSWFIFNRLLRPLFPASTSASCEGEAHVCSKHLEVKKSCLQSGIPTQGAVAMPPTDVEGAGICDENCPSDSLPAARSSRISEQLHPGIAFRSATRVVAVVALAAALVCFVGFSGRHHPATELAQSS